MQNKGLKYSLIAAIVCLSLNELLWMGNAFMVKMLYGTVEFDPVVWSHAISYCSSAILGVLYLSLIAAGVCLLAGNKQSLPALLGGGLLSLHGLLSFLRIVLYHGFRLDILYNHWITWFMVVLYATALILIAAHYKNGALIGLAVTKAVLSVVFMAARMWVPDDITYGIIIGIDSILGFIVSLLVFIFWLRQVNKE